MPEPTDTVIRAFELPLQGCMAETWPLLRECWRHSTELANWCVFELARADGPLLDKHPGVKGRKLKGLYGLASETFKMKTGWWAGACISASTICRDVESAYRRERNKVVRLHKQSLRTYRYPYPWPVHASGWKAAGLDESGKPWIDVALPGGTVRLHLRGGPEFGRQLTLFRCVVKGDLPRLALSIREQPCSTGCHRPHGAEKAAGGGQSRPMRVMVKMVARLPVLEKPGDRVLTLCTDPRAFWVAELDGRQAWVLNADHVKRAQDWINAHEDMLDRLSQDTKAERRLRTGRLRQLQEARQKRVQKHHDRVASWLHEITAHVVGFAVRQRVGAVVYHDRDRGFISRFPWARLKGLLADKLKAAGITLHAATDEGEGGSDAEVA